MPEILVLVVVLLAVYGMVSKRPALSVWAIMLLAGGVFLGITMLYFVPSVPQHAAPHSIVMVHDGLDHSVFPPLAPTVPVNQPRPAIWALILMVATILLVVFFLRRASCSAAVAGGHFRWWPALLLLIPLFVLLQGVRLERLKHSATWEPNFQHSEHVIHVAEAQGEIAEQQAELHRQAMEAMGEVQRQIASMNIYELMDKFDAPRILLHGSPAAPPAAPPAKAPHDAAVAASDGSTTTALASAQPSGSAVMVTAEAPVEVIAEAGVDDDAEHELAPTAIDEAEAASDVAVETEANWPRRVVAPAQGPPPVWVNQPPKRVGHVRREVVATDEYATVEECYLAADILLQIKTYDHIRWLTGSPQDADKYISLDRTTLSPSELETHATGLFRQLQNAGITVDYIRREIAKDEHLDTVERSVGPMKKLYTLLEFSPSVDADLRQNWEASQRQASFALVGFGASSVLGLLGLAWGLLKVDTMTKGYYTKRLFIGVPLGIVSLFGLYALLLEMGFDLPH